MINLKYEEVKNWESVKEVINSNEHILNSGACSLRKRDELIKETDHLKKLLKRHEREKLKSENILEDNNDVDDSKIRKKIIYTYSRSGRLVTGKTKHTYWEVDNKLFRTKELAMNYLRDLGDSHDEAWK